MNFKCRLCNKTANFPPSEVDLPLKECPGCSVLFTNVEKFSIPLTRIICQHKDQYNNPYYEDYPCPYCSVKADLVNYQGHYE